MATAPYHHGDLPNALRAAAVDLIIERGPAGFSLREVARRAGVSHAAPAHHFGDATGLLTSLAVEAFQRLLAAMEAAADGVDDPSERLQRVGVAYVETGRDFPGHCAVLFRRDLVDTDDPGYALAGAAAYDFLEGVVQSVADQLNPSLDVDTASRLCWSAMQGLLQLHSTMVEIAGTKGRPMPDLAEESRVFTRLMLAGMLPT